MHLRSSTRTIMLIAILALTALPFSTTFRSGPAPAGPGYSLAYEGAGEIVGVPYVWQEVNGFCHWASLSMALQYAGIDLDLYGLFAATGIGFSAAYVRYDDVMIMLPGTTFRQMVPLVTLTELYGLNSSIYFDPTVGFGELYSQFMGVWDVNYTKLDGETDAFNLMRQTIDGGYPLLTWTDPYYLPPEDYDLAREYGVTSAESGTGHSILIIGYNDTAETAQIMDPGIGIMGNNYGYPYDGRYQYSINYTALNQSWSALGYGCIVVKPDEGRIDDFNHRLGSFIYDRLMGDRQSYAPDAEDVFFVTFGADAFLGMSYDLTINSLKTYLEEFDEATYPKETKIAVLHNLGFMTETLMTMQYLSYRSALEVLPSLLSELDLEAVIEAGRAALPHLEALSSNETLTTIDLTNHTSLLTDTFSGISASYSATDDLEIALSEHESDLNKIAAHLSGISDVWVKTAETLKTALSNNWPISLTIVYSSGAVILVAIVVVVIRRRTRKQN